MDLSGAGADGMYSIACAGMCDDCAVFPVIWHGKNEMVI